MAHHVEPMDVDSTICDFDNKENRLHHTNVLAQGACTEKGYEELEVSELNMKLRYSITPTSSPMSKSFTANCLDHKQFAAGDNNISVENENLTSSVNSTITRSDSVKKVLPLQSLPTDQLIDGNRNASRSQDSAVSLEKDVIITVSRPNDLDENLSIPSSSSSLAHTPEATTPTKEFNKYDGGSPIMRGLKSVLNMFRPSQSPITTTDDNIINPEAFSPPVMNSPNTSDSTPSIILVSTPLAAQKTALSKKETPNRDSIIFKNNLENELEWKDESIIFSNEKIPIPKLFLTQSKPVVSKSVNEVKETEAEENLDSTEENLDSTVEYMDISYNDSVVKDKTITQTEEAINKNDITYVTESDSEFLDCETTFSKSENKNDMYSKQDDEVKEKHNEGLITDVTNESKETAKPPVDIENNVTPLEERKGDSVDKEITSSNLTINTCEAPASLSQLEVEKAFKCSDHVSPTCNIDLDIDNHTYSNANKIDNDVQNIETIKPSVDSDKLSGNIVVSSLSQIPLIADPRVLLFNIPDETFIPAQTMQNTEYLKSTPADYPLPDDEDFENFEINEKGDKQDPIANNLIIDGIKQSPISEMLFSTLPATLLSYDEIPTKNIIKKDLDGQYEQIKITEPLEIQYKDDNENKVIEVDVSTNTNNTESFPEFNQVKLHNSVERNDVIDVALVHKTEVIPSQIVKILETTNENISVILNKHVYVKDNSVTSKESIEMPPSTSEIDHHCHVIQNYNNDVTKSDLPEEISTVAVIPRKVETVLHEQDEDEEQALVDDQNVPELQSTIVEEMDISYVTAVTSETKNLCNAATNEEITDVDKTIYQYSTNSSLEEDIDNEIYISDGGTILEKEIKDEKIHEDINDNVANFVSEKCNETMASTTSLPEDNFISTDFTQVDDSVANVVSEKCNEILAPTTIHKDNFITDQKTEIVDDNVANVGEKRNEILASTASIQEGNLTSTDLTQNIEQGDDNMPNVVNEKCNEILVHKDNFISTDVTHKTEQVDDNVANVVSENCIKILASAASIQEDNLTSTDFTQNTEQVNENMANVVSEKCNEILAPTTSIRKDNFISTDVTQKTEQVHANVANVVSEKCNEILVPTTSIHEDNSISIDVTQRIEQFDVNVDNVVCECNETPVLTTSIHKDNFILSYFTQNIEQVDDNVANIVSEKCNEDEPEETITTMKATVESHLEKESFASKDNSPFVAILADDFEDSPKSLFKEYDVDNQNKIKTDIDISPTLSPIIVSKGYNFNFDEIEDQLFIKTKIKLSPSQNSSPNESFENIEISVTKPKTDLIGNRRESQPARKKLVSNKKLNSYFSGTSKPLIDNQDCDEILCNDQKVIHEEIKTMPMSSLKANKDLMKNNITDEKLKCEGHDFKNVFNLPEIDDANFNPFVTKSKVRVSPVPFQHTDDLFTKKNKITSSPVPNKHSQVTEYEKNYIKEHNEPTRQAIVTSGNKSTVLEEHNLLNDASNTNCLSQSTDAIDTVNEVHTEDEDTIEGPFLEAEDVDHKSKISDFGSENVETMRLSELPIQGSENQEAGELFIDAEAFDFFLNQNKANEVTDSGKESLFLKFDPLYAKRMSSDGVVAALKRVQEKQSTPKKIAEFLQNNKTFDKSPVAGPSTINISHETDDHNKTEESIEDLNTTVIKPMMVVNPAVNPIPAPRNITPVRSNRQSLTFTSPAIAVIDRLLSMSANNSLIGHDTTITEVCGRSKADLALTQLRELLADKEISVYNLKSESKELKQRLTTLESQMKNLEAISEERLKKNNELSEKLDKKTKMNMSMATIVEEYERTIARLIADTEQDRKQHAEERLQLINDRDQQVRHLNSMEVSFSDLNSKYEKCKQMIFSFKANEDSLKKSIKDFEENRTKMETNYELLKQHATSKLNHANEELQKIKRAHETEVLKLNATIKRQELHITSLEETLLQKTKANQELTAICDELINRVG